MFTFPPPPKPLPAPEECIPYVEWAVDMSQSLLQWMSLVLVVFCWLILGLMTWVSMRNTRNMVKKIAEASKEEREIIFRDYGVGVKRKDGEKEEGGEV
jgi:hypothetical protein